VTPDAPDGTPDDEESALLRADYLMRRHQRPATAPESGVDTAAEEDFIPTLTDLVRLGYRTAVAAPPLAAPAPTPPAPPIPPAPERDAAGPPIAPAGFSIPPAPTPESTLPDIFDPTLAPPADEAASGIDFVLDEPLPAIPDPADDPLAIPISPAPPLWVAPRMDALPQLDTPTTAEEVPAPAAPEKPEAEPPAHEAMIGTTDPATAPLPLPAAVPAAPLHTRPGHVRAILERRLRAELSELVDQALAEVSLELQARMGRILRETLDEAETDARADADPGHEAKPG
jgi:hypothetical protein